MLGVSADSNFRETFCRFEVAMVVTMATTLLMGAASLGLGIYTYTHLDGQPGANGAVGGQGEQGNPGLLASGSTFTIPAHTYYVCAGAHNESVVLSDTACLI